jgi:hypothetical protein
LLHGAFRPSRRFGNHSRRRTGAKNGDLSAGRRQQHQQLRPIAPIATVAIVAIAASTSSPFPN